LEVLQLQEFAGALLNNATKTALAEELESICTRRAEAQKKKKKKKKKKLHALLRRCSLCSQTHTGSVLQAATSRKQQVVVFQEPPCFMK
jgi:hypothetical protein